MHFCALVDELGCCQTAAPGQHVGRISASGVLLVGVAIPRWPSLPTLCMAVVGSCRKVRGGHGELLPGSTGRRVWWVREGKIVTLGFGFRWARLAGLHGAGGWSLGWGQGLA